MKPKFLLKRVYEKADSSDGCRILVERLWPRGIKKAALELELWVKDVAPSTALRQWFAHDPKKWSEFQRRYRAELAANRAPWLEILALAKKRPVTLLFSSRDLEHNNAVALRSFLEAQVKD